ncbi:hypothetical protein LIER_13663 [Lithospermum erythrorhizon]|uniref:Uncharacterized protein n=1 Tax=Lithospermum erythrorhizon TaxID=34254 RepID=A0AAV3PXW1_LITER
MMKTQLGGSWLGAVARAVSGGGGPRSGMQKLATTPMDISSHDEKIKGPEKLRGWPEMALKTHSWPRPQQRRRPEVTKMTWHRYYNPNLQCGSWWNQT